MKIFNQTLAVLSLATLVSCGASNPTTGGSSNPLTASISSISAGVAAIGSGLQSSQATQFALSPDAVTDLVSGLCDEHGTPIQLGTSTPYNQTDAIFPYIHTYCATTVVDGDTVRGGFSLVEGLVCSLEKGGIEFNGVAQSITVDFLDTDCWPSGGPGGGGGPTSASISATGSAPASFNANFEKGVIFTVADFGLTFKVAANISSDSIQFIAHESWSGAAAGDSVGNTGVMAGSLNKTTGILQFEKRDERVRSTCANSSCGWNRHTRLTAQLTMSGGEPSGLSSLSYGFADTQIPDPTDLAAPNTHAVVITADGDLTSGIKANLFYAQNAALTNAGLWTHAPATGCATSAGYDSAGACGPGLNSFTDARFALLSSLATTSASPSTATTPDAWLAAFTSFNFLQVDVNVDQAF